MGVSVELRKNAIENPLLFLIWADGCKGRFYKTYAQYSPPPPAP